MKTLLDVSDAFVEQLIKQPDVWGDRTFAFVEEFMVTNKICPETMQLVLRGLMGKKLPDGRHLTKAGYTHNIVFDEEMSRRICAQKWYHAGGLVCPRK